MIDFIVKWWMEALFTGLTAFVVASYRSWQKAEAMRLKEQKDEEEAHREEFKKLIDKVHQISGSHKVILKDRLYDRYRKHLAEGSCDLEEKEIFMEMYRDYKAIGGNGVIDSIYETMMAMPTCREEKEGR